MDLRAHSTLTRGLACLVATLWLATPSAARAQNRGQYILGAGGLNAGMQAPRGLTTGLFYVHYDASRFRNVEGESIPVDGTYTVQGGELLLAYTTPWQFAGGSYGASIVLFYMQGQISSEQFGTAGSTGFGDMYVEPVSFGWHLPRGSMKVAYGFIAPTGDPGVTTDFWGHDLTLAFTFLATPRTQLSVNHVREWHQKKESSDLTVGDNTNLEVALGRTFIFNGGTIIAQAGVVGYAQWQLEEDRGADAIALLKGQHDRVYAAGPEIGLAYPGLKTSFLLRLEQEFGARARAEGWTLFTGFAKSF